MVNDDIRARWRATLEQFRPSPGAPASAAYWSAYDTASRDELRSVQDQKLRLAVRYAYECVPFYRRKFDTLGIGPGDITSVDDLAAVPVTTKQEMADDLAAHPPWGTYTAVDDQLWVERGWQIFASSGTTGPPRAFRYTAFDREMWQWTNARAMWAMNFRPGRDVAMLAFGYGPHVWLWGVHYALNLMGIPIITAGGIDSATRGRFIERYSPTILACTPSYALYLATVMAEMGIDPAASSVRHLFCAGEPGFSVPATRRRLEDLWAADLHEFYGCTEAAPSAGGHTCAAVAAEKDATPSTHLLEDTHVWEVVDPTTLERQPDGAPGLSVVTNLCSEASPQIRFLVGDYATLTSDRCACGRTHHRAAGGFRGRADDMLNIRGVTVFPSSIENVVRRVPGLGDEFQIIVTTERDLDVLTVQAESASGAPADSRDDLARRLEQQVRAECEVRPVVEVRPPGTLPRTEFKAKRVQDRREAAAS